MSLLTTLRKDKMLTLKEKDVLKNGVCSLLISSIALAEKEQGRELSEEEIIAAIDKIMADKGIDASGKNRGILIKEMLSTYAGKTDGKSVNKGLASRMK